MPNAIAILPWVYVDEPRDFGSVRLLPFKRGELPGDQSNIKQTDIDGIFRAYANRPNHRVGQGTIVELEEWRAGMEASPEVVTELFRVKEILAFSALTLRSLFRQHYGYCNYDTYTMVVQRFKPGETGTFAFSSRRRDGATNQLWGSDEFAFQMPIHVTTSSRIAIDVPLFEALLSLPPEYSNIYDALLEFNLANTDSSGVGERVELVMCKSAFEGLLGVGTTAAAMANALRTRLEGIGTKAADGPLIAKWLARYQHEARPLTAWAKDFCALRGVAAHGAKQLSFVWQSQHNLAFVALFFPLLLKKVLADAGLLAMDSYDAERLRRVDDYLAHDPFDFDWRDPSAGRPWELVTNLAKVASRACEFNAGNGPNPEVCT